MPEAYWQLSESVRGLGDACRALGMPVTGGNVSLYNESPLGRIAPTAQIGIVGLLDDIDLLVGPRSRHEGDLVVLLGETGPGHGRLDLRAAGRRRARRSAAALDLAREAALHEVLRRAAARRAAPLRPGRQRRRPGRRHRRVRDLGAASAPTCSCRSRSAPAVALFGESPSRAVVTVQPERWPELARLAAGHARCRAAASASVGGDRLRIRLVGVGATGAAEERGAGVADELDVPLADLRRAWTHGLPRALGEVA